MAEGDLARDGNQAHEAESPRGVGRAEADLDQVLGLMHLHGVPGEEPAKVAGGDPPEARRAHGAAERPVHGGPRRVHDVGGLSRRALGWRCIAVRREAHVLGAAADEEVERCQQHEHHDGHGPARRAPAASPDEELHPRQDHDGSHSHAGVGQAHGEAASAHEPVGQEESLPRVAEAHAAAAHEHPEGEIELPLLAHEGGEEEAPAYGEHADLVHHARAATVHEAAEHGAQDGGDHETEGERARRHPALPAELREDGREEQGEGGARVDSHAHGDEDDADDDPAVEERKTHRVPIAERARREYQMTRRSSPWDTTSSSSPILSTASSRKTPGPKDARRSAPSSRRCWWTNRSSPSISATTSRSARFFTKTPSSASASSRTPITGPRRASRTITARRGRSTARRGARR